MQLFYNAAMRRVSMLSLPVETRRAFALLAIDYPLTIFSVTSMLSRVALE